jgi:basic amino acid/polyamine antiporter, APA family
MAQGATSTDVTGRGELRRSLSLPLITFFGLGTILGAGIYVLVGKVAATAGIYAPLAFVFAAVTAGLSAFVYMELCSRYPLSGGAAVYTAKGFGIRWLSILVGFLIVLSGLVSAATITRGFVGYFQIFFDLPDAAIVIGALVALGVLAAWGIAQSTAAAAVATIIEVAGLLLIIFVARDALGTLPDRLPDLIPPMSAFAWQGIVLGGFLAFYAFIGFEDMVNVAEEVKDAQRTLPRAIILAVGIATLLYLAISLIAVLALPLEELGASAAPLALIYERSTGDKPTFMALIALFAVINGALIQIIMASRMLYGMSREGWLPKIIGKVHPRTQTPIIATALVVAMILVFALALPLVTLAKVTSFALLVVFALIGVALIRMKRREPAWPGVFSVPMWVPYGSVATAIVLLGFHVFDLFAG